MNFILIAVERAADGTPLVNLDPVAVPDTDAFATVQGLVGGFIQPLDIDGDIVGVRLWVDEDGIAKGLPLNPVADRLVRNIGLMPGDHLRGTAVLTGVDPDTGEIAGLTESQRVPLVTRLIDETVALAAAGSAVIE